MRFQIVVAVVLLLMMLVAFGCAGCAPTIRIDDEVPDAGNPYQKVFLLHDWRMP